MLRERPFIKAHLGKQIRKVAIYKANNKQFTTEQFDQFMAKCRTDAVLSALCDMVEEDTEFSWRKLSNWIMQKFSSIRRLVESFDDVSLEHPEMFYNMAPKTRGRRAMRDRGPRYQEDFRFQADKEKFFAELREDE